MQTKETVLRGGSTLQSTNSESPNDKIVNFPSTQQNTTENKTIFIKGDISSVCDLMCELAIKARFNELTHAVEIDGMPDGYSKANAANTVVPYLHDEAKKRMKASRQLIEDTLLLETDKNRFHPVKEMLLSTKWDGQDRFSTIRSILHVEESSLDWILIYKWLWQSVAMVFNDIADPFGADGVLVLKGPQGIGKTRFFVRLACKPAWVLEGACVDVDRVDSIIQTTSAWLVELGELDGVLKRDQPALKAFLTASCDTYRHPYAKAAIKEPRRTSFCATVNPDQFLNDATGSRRYWTVEVEKIDVARLNELPASWFEQLWAQVYSECYLINPQGFRLTDDERFQLTSRNKAYDKPLMWEIEVRDSLAWESSIDSWCWWRVSDLKNQLPVYGASSEQIGRVLKKIAMDDSRVIQRKPRNVSEYFLPQRRLPHC